MPRITRRVSTDGSMEILDINAIPDLLLAVPVASEAGIEKAARKMQDAMHSIYDTENAVQDQWPQNAPVTQILKGFNRPMDETGSLLNAIDIKKESADLPKLSPATLQRIVGWFDDIHPGTKGRLTMAQLAVLHEFSYSNEAFFPIPEGVTLFGGSKLPPRPWIRPAADVYGERIVEELAFDLLAVVMKFNIVIPGLNDTGVRLGSG